ncbi:MAG: hypothetical protein M9962_10435 [Oligoflexia bacterium]|nr:hypothetical protein [Oligoflexia bacterium]
MFTFLFLLLVGGGLSSSYASSLSETVLEASQATGFVMQHKEKIVLEDCTLRMVAGSKFVSLSLYSKKTQVMVSAYVPYSFPWREGVLPTNENRVTMKYESEIFEHARKFQDGLYQKEATLKISMDPEGKRVSMALAKIKASGGYPINEQEVLKLECIF